MRIMDLSFKEALKYMYLGDMAYRLKDGRGKAIAFAKSRVQSDDYKRGLLTDLMITQDPYRVVHSGACHIEEWEMSLGDFMAHDWVVEDTLDSV